MRGQTALKARREDALKRRTNELNYWKSQKTDDKDLKKTFAQKIAIAEKDIANIQKKL